MPKLHLPVIVPVVVPAPVVMLLTVSAFVEDILNLFKTNRLKGVHILNSDNKKIHVRDIAEQHILEDFRGKFIPTINDYINNLKLKNWMNNALGEINPEKTIDDNKHFKAVINID